MEAPVNRFRAARHLRTAVTIFIILYGALVPAVIITGGFEIDLLGLHFNDLSNPVSVLSALLGAWLVLSLPTRELALVAGSLLTGIVLLELLLRAWNPPIAGKGLIQMHRPSKIYGWELIPGAEGIGVLGHPIRINGDGCRDMMSDRQRPSDMARIVAVGDSFTFGVSVALEETYHKQLAARFESRTGQKMETISTGVPGYGMWQHLEVLRNKALGYHPDAIILQLYHDDITAGRRPYTHPDDWDGYNPFGLTRMRTHSYLFNLIHNTNMLLETKYRHRKGHEYLAGLAQRRRALGPKHPNHPSHRILYGTADPEQYTAFEASLAAFIAKVRASRVPLVVVYVPDGAQMGVPDAQAVNRYLTRLFSDHQVPFIDATIRFEQEPDPKPLYLFPLDAHISKRGHRLIAEMLDATIVSHRLLSDKTTHSPSRSGGNIQLTPPPPR